MLILTWTREEKRGLEGRARTEETSASGGGASQAQVTYAARRAVEEEGSCATANKCNVTRCEAERACVDGLGREDRGSATGPWMRVGCQWSRWGARCRGVKGRGHRIDAAAMRRPARDCASRRGRLSCASGGEARRPIRMAVIKLRRTSQKRYTGAAPCDGRSRVDGTNTLVRIRTRSVGDVPGKNAMGGMTGWCAARRGSPVPSRKRWRGVRRQPAISALRESPVVDGNAEGCSGGSGRGAWMG
ncbi:hypothetical protein B0H19DRAFT_1240863 [Mycena capillaripes]|nr:hypothetical protein B0H19DRAFT_1240863 [Mycena capillaripes]